MATELPFSDLMALQYCDEDGVYWGRRGHASFVWLAHAIDCEHIGGGARRLIADTVGRAVGKMPPGTCVQFIACGVSNIDWAIRDYLRYGDGTNNIFLKQLQNAKANFFREATQGLESTVGQDVNAKDLQVLIVVTVREQMTKRQKRHLKDTLDALAKPKKQTQIFKGRTMTRSLRRSQQEVIPTKMAIMEARAAMEATFDAIRLPRRPCDPETLIRFTRSIVHPGHGAEDPVVYDPEEYLFAQVPTERIEIQDKGRTIESGGNYSGIMTLRKWPKPSYAGILSLRNETLGGGLSVLDLIGSGVMCVNVEIMERSEVMAWATDYHERAGRGEDRLKNEPFLRGAQEWIRMIQDEDRDGMRVSVSFKINARSEYQLETRCRQFASSLSALAVVAQREDTDAKSWLTQMLPGSFTEANRKNRRFPIRHDEAVGSILPIYLTGRGTRRFATMAFTEHYEPLALDLFDHPNAFNAAVVGQPGSGKSVVINDLMTDTIRNPGMKWFVIDYGLSYTNSMQLLGDEAMMVPLSIKQPRPWNICAGTLEERIPWVKSWIWSVAMMPGEEVDPVVDSMLSRVIKIAYHAHCEYGVPYDTVEQLRRDNPGKYVDRAAKRFRIETMSETAQSQVDGLMQGEPTKRPRFSIFFRFCVKHFQNDGESREVNEVGDINEENLIEVTDQFDRMEEDDDGVFVLIEKREHVAAIEASGLFGYIESEYQVLEVERFQDLQQALEAGATLDLEPDFKAEREERIRKEVAARIGLGHQQYEAMVHAQVSRVDPREVYDSKTGFANLQNEITLSVILREAKRLQDKRIDDLIERLNMWYGNGIYAKFFDRHGTMDFDKHRAYYFDITEVANSDKRLAMGLLGAVMSQITAYCDSPFNRDFRKHVAIDEFNKMLKDIGKPVYSFVDNLTRQSRKNGYSAIIGTQSLSDITNIKLHPQFQHYLFGSPTPQDMEEMATALDFTAEMQAVASQAKTVPGRYSDFLLFIGNADGGGKVCQLRRLVLTPFSYWLVTSYDKERAYRDKRVSAYLQEGRHPTHAYILAVRDCAREHPRGLRVESEVAIA